MRDVDEALRRIADEDPLVALAGVRELRGVVDQLEGIHVAVARRGHASWTEIGEALGISKQAAHRRHGGPDDPGRRTVVDDDWPPKVTGR